MAAIRLMTSVAAFLALGAASGAASAADAMASLKGTTGEDAGQVLLTATPNGTLLRLDLRNMPAGAHAFHVHETGKCLPPFASAGGHFNPTNDRHGLGNEEGMHAGDMPNIHVPASGVLTQEILNTRLKLDSTLMDGDGASIVVHFGPDDYETDPAGAAGPRIACGVIAR